MKKMREYLAQADSGSDFWEFTFYSESRAGSKKNFEDAKNAMIHKYGMSKRHNKITNIQLKDWN